MQRKAIIAAASGAAIGFLLTRRAHDLLAAAVVDTEHAVTIRRTMNELRELWLKRDQWWQWMRPPLDAELVQTTENEIRFSALGQLEGAVAFTELASGRGTEVRLRLRHTRQARPWSLLLDASRGLEPTARLKEDLRRFKQLAECGELASNESPSARKPREAEVGDAMKRAMNVASTLKHTTIERGAL